MQCDGVVLPTPEGLPPGIEAPYGVSKYCDEPTIYGDGEQTRDYVFVGDVVEAFLAAIHHNSDGVFNVGTGIETSVLDLLDAVSAADTLGWKATTALRDGIRITYEALTQTS